MPDMVRFADSKSLKPRPNIIRHFIIPWSYWNYYIRLDIKLRDLGLHKLTLNHEKKKQKLQYII